MGKLRLGDKHGKKTFLTVYQGGKVVVTKRQIVNK